MFAGRVEAWLWWRFFSAGLWCVTTLAALDLVHQAQGLMHWLVERLKARQTGWQVPGVWGAQPPHDDGA